MTNVITRFMTPETALNFLKNGAEIAPSMAYYPINKKSKTGAIDFGGTLRRGIGLLAHPAELDIKRNLVYPYDAYTPFTPDIQRIPSKKQYATLSSQFGNFPREDAAKIRKLSANPEEYNLYKESSYFGNLIRRLSELSDDYFKNNKQQGNFPDYLTMLQRQLENNSDEFISREVADLSENSIRRHLKNNPHSARQYWRNLAPFESIKKQEDLEDIINNRLSIKNGRTFPSRAAKLLKQDIMDEFGSDNNKSALTQLKSLADDFINNGMDGETELSPAIEKLRPQMQQYFGDINKAYNDIAISDKKLHYPRARETVARIRKEPTDYLEIKVPRLVKPENYMGAIYPEIDRDNFRGKLEKIYGNRAIPYDATSVKSLMNALQELTEKLGKSFYAVKGGNKSFRQSR